MKIVLAEATDLQTILELQYLAYQSEAKLLKDYFIPPLKDTLEEIKQEYSKGIILKAIDESDHIIGSVRAHSKDNTSFIGKLMVHPNHQGNGIGSKLLLEIEKIFPKPRYELFTSDRSVKNLKFYKRMGYIEFKEKDISLDLRFVYLEKYLLIK